MDLRQLVQALDFQRARRWRVGLQGAQSLQEQLVLLSQEAVKFRVRLILSLEREQDCFGLGQ